MVILIHKGGGAYYAHHISNLVIALPDFQTFLRPWAGIGMQKSQYYKLFRGSFKNYVGICVKFEQCNYSSFNTHIFLWSSWVVDDIAKLDNSCITKNILLLNEKL